VASAPTRFPGSRSAPVLDTRFRSTNKSLALAVVTQCQGCFSEPAVCRLYPFPLCSISRSIVVGSSDAASIRFRPERGGALLCACLTTIAMPGPQLLRNQYLLLRHGESEVCTTSTSLFDAYAASWLRKSQRAPLSWGPMMRCIGHLLDLRCGCLYLCCLHTCM